MTSRSWSLFAEFLFPARVRRSAIPDLDRGLAPNDRLQEAARLGSQTQGVMAALPLESGHVLIGRGADIVEFDPDSDDEKTIATLTANVTALALDMSGAILVGIDGAGVHRVDFSGSVTPVLVEHEGKPLSCVTAISSSPAGEIAIAQGSSHGSVVEWARDLMEASPGRARSRVVGQRI